MLWLLIRAALIHNRLGVTREGGRESGKDQSRLSALFGNRWLMYMYLYRKSLGYSGPLTHTHGHKHALQGHVRASRVSGDRNEAVNV